MGKSSPGAFAVVSGKVGGLVGYALKNSKNKANQGWRGYQPVVRNPKSEGQLYQRAILKTVVNMYAAGKEIFDHSFQGKVGPGNNQREFTRINAKALRAAIVAEVQGATEPANAKNRVVAPGVLYATPNEYIISRGTYNQNFFSWNAANFSFRSLVPETNETGTQFAERVGLVPGDLYTFVFLGMIPEPAAYATPGNRLASQYPSEFGWVRMQVKDTIPTTANFTFLDVFEITGSRNARIITTDLVFGNDITLSTLVGTTDTVEGALGCIRSRLDEDLRSDSTMHLGEFELQYGIVSPYLLPVWQANGGALGNSELILEGGDDPFGRGV